MVTATVPGVTADSDGLFHGLGDHASNQFSLDGQPITDQQSKVFSNQIPVDAVQSVEVIEGAPPAEYGDKTSLVIAVTTRSGLGTKPAHGDITASYGTFGTSNEDINLAVGGNKAGNFISLSGLNTGRFLDSPELAVIHDHGNEENLFDRVDFKPTQGDTLSANLSFTRPGSRLPTRTTRRMRQRGRDPIARYSGTPPCAMDWGRTGRTVGSTDQRSQIRTFNVAPTWTRVVDQNTVFTFGGFARQDQYYYYPSANPFADVVPDLTLETVGQHRTLTDLGLRTNVAYAKGIHNLKIGATYSDTIVTERDDIGLLVPEQSDVYHFYGHANIRELALFAQDTSASSDSHSI